MKSASPRPPAKRRKLKVASRPQTESTAAPALMKPAFVGVEDLPFPDAEDINNIHFPELGRSFSYNSIT